MKKIIACIVMSLITSCAFAKTITVDSKTAKLQETIAWQFDQQNDGRLFILGPESDHSLLIQVAKFSSTGLPADPITVSCNGTRNRVGPTESITCYGNFIDSVFMGIEPQDFKHGSAGTYTFVPVKKAI